MNYGSMGHGLMKNCSELFDQNKQAKIAMSVWTTLDNLDNVRLETSWRFGSRKMQQYLKDITNTLQVT